MVSEKTVSSEQVEGNLLFLDVPSQYLWQENEYKT